tara:strand:- start:6598 stop:6771 length:174 start_codon:yes stop_codon:yes gene_type:complete
MANYAVTDFVTPIGSLVEVVAAMETQIETIDDSKTLRVCDIKQISGDTFVGVIIHDA